MNQYILTMTTTLSSYGVVRFISHAELYRRMLGITFGPPCTTEPSLYLVLFIRPGPWRGFIRLPKLPSIIFNFLGFFKAENRRQVTWHADPLIQSLQPKTYENTCRFWLHWSNKIGSTSSITKIFVGFGSFQNVPMCRVSVNRT